MLTRGGLNHQYGFAGYYAEPYHVLMLSDAYPPDEDMRGGGIARYAQVPLNAAVAGSGRAGLAPYVGMDPSDPGTWSRPYNPQPGMFSRLHEDQAAAAAREPARKRRGFARRG